LDGVVEVDVMDRAESVRLVGQRAPLADEQGLGPLGDLPLAIEQAAAYLDQTGLPAADYLRLLGTRTAELLGRGRLATREDLLRAMSEAGRTVLFSSHILEEVEQIARRSSPMRARRASSSCRRGRARPPMARARAPAALWPPPERCTCRRPDFASFVRALPQLARQHGIRLYEVSPADESLESVFSYLVAR
jgi:hypothetical protein